ncbi:MAG TPA: SIS domain-containing protein [Candidatus Gallacutalibacter stercoravium]|nr:SIS domain-containing protein [Candidatus Gallacutalibacter stercoravium]
MEQNGGQFEKLADVALQELRRVFDKMNGEEVEPFLQEILNARRVFLLSAGREGLATRAFAMRLMHLGFRAYWIWDDTTPAIGPGDVLLCASGSGDTGHELYICRRAREAGARILLVTACDTGSARQLADTALKIPAAAYRAQGDFVPTQQCMGNLFEQALFLFFDVASMLLAQRMGVTPQQMEQRHRNVE